MQVSGAVAGSFAILPFTQGVESEGGEGNGNPLQYSCLENPRDRGTWGATVYGVVKESDTT